MNALWFNHLWSPGWIFKMVINFCSIPVLFSWYCPEFSIVHPHINPNHLSCPRCRKASPQQDVAITMFHCQDAMSQLMWGISLAFSMLVTRAFLVLSDYTTFFYMLNVFHTACGNTWLPTCLSIIKCFYCQSSIYQEQQNRSVLTHELFLILSHRSPDFNKLKGPSDLTSYNYLSAVVELIL